LLGFDANSAKTSLPGLADLVIEQEMWATLAAASRVCDARWSSYADYARLRLSGLRADALAAADQCARQVVGSGAGDDFTRWIFAEVVRPGIRLTLVLPEQLRGIALPALWRAHDAGQTWATEALLAWFPVEVMAAESYCDDPVREFLRRAVAAFPDDAVLRRLLARHLLTWVRQDTVDIAHGRYDGDPHADLSRLAEARGLAADARDPLVDEIEEVRGAVNGWIADRNGGS
jgi:hypothetical protein